VLTSFLLGSTAGIVAGGVFATRSTRHHRIASVGLLAAALIVLVLAWVPVPHVAFVPIFALAGFALGATGPSRDLIVRGATPPGAAGRVYGFVYSGLDLGGMLGPIAFGFMIDHGAAHEVLYACAACFALAIATVLKVEHAVGAHRAAPMPQSD
jgi:MFS family permease